MLNPGGTTVLPPPCRPLPGHGRPWHSWAVPFTASAARNGHHYRTRWIPSALPVTGLSYIATFILVYVSRFSAFMMFPPFPFCCYRVIYLRGKWPGAKAFPRPGRQDWGWRGDPRQGRPSDSVPWSTKDHRWCRAGLCPEIGQRETDKWPSEPWQGWQAVCCAFQLSPWWWHHQTRGPGTWKVGAQCKSLVFDLARPQKYRSLVLKIIDFVGAFVVCLNVQRNQLINVI